MRIAIPVWNGRVSPVFDVARTICVADIDGELGEPNPRAIHALNPVRPVSTLTDLGIDLLACSAISAPLASAMSAAGIEVISDICGSPDEIIEALAAGGDGLEGLRSPGSRRDPKRSFVARTSRQGREPQSSR
ncbi:MAG: NifB/NifX family molybdenum-iron cluster-binding protein [Thermoanaerobaculales bacterium]|jgi:predicted Fe-Mo cluster-binding NifX family protein|nr:NifB/NifX family molybdenum-iron cluster-binding protein [Thermoanaerobaculales bacterium]